MVRIDRPVEREISMVGKTTQPRFVSDIEAGEVLPPVEFELERIDQRVSQGHRRNIARPFPGAETGTAHFYPRSEAAPVDYRLPSRPGTLRAHALLVQLPVSFVGSSRRARRRQRLLLRGRPSMDLKLEVPTVAGRLGVDVDRYLAAEAPNRCLTWPRVVSCAARPP